MLLVSSHPNVPVFLLQFVVGHFSPRSQLRTTLHPVYSAVSRASRHALGLNLIIAVVPTLDVVEHAHEDDPFGKRLRAVLNVPPVPEMVNQHFNFFQNLNGGVSRRHVPLNIDRLSGKVKFSFPHVRRPDRLHFAHPARGSGFAARQNADQCRRQSMRRCALWRQAALPCGPR